MRRWKNSEIKCFSLMDLQGAGLCCCSCLASPRSEAPSTRTQLKDVFLDTRCCSKREWNLGVPGLLEVCPVWTLLIKLSYTSSIFYHVCSCRGSWMSLPMMELNPQHKTSLLLHFCLHSASVYKWWGGINLLSDPATVGNDMLHSAGCYWTFFRLAKQATNLLAANGFHV